MKTSERFVLDSFAVLAYLEGESAASRVADVLASGDPWMTLVNLGEVTYISERDHGTAIADRVFANLLAENRPDGGRSIQLVPVDEALTRRAATSKARGGMSYADYFAAAAAIHHCAILISDPGFVAAERAGISVAWL